MKPIAFMKGRFVAAAISGLLFCHGGFAVFPAT